MVICERKRVFILFTDENIRSTLHDVRGIVTRIWYNQGKPLKSFSAKSEYSYSLPKKLKRAKNFLVCREPNKDVAVRLVSALLSFSKMLKVSRISQTDEGTSPSPKNGKTNEYYMNEQVQVFMLWDNAHAGRLRKLHGALFHSWTNTSNPIYQSKIWLGDAVQLLQLTLS